MIDIHHHCLPGVDDGPHDWSEAVDLCKMAADDGIETIVATPHVLRGRWRTRTRPELSAKLDGLREKTNDTPRLLLGSEYFFGHDVADLLARGEGIIPLAGSRYVLTEFASHAVPPMIEQPFFQMQLDQWTPIIAHPERNHVFQSKPEMLLSLIRIGAKVQVTAASLMGDFGEDARATAVAWLEAQMVHFIASDAHNTTKRKPRMRAAAEAVREISGEDVARALTQLNPLCVVEGRPLDYEPEPLLPKKPGLLKRLRQLFS